ncbi:hypothetical protein H0H93_015992 [Arthromyces matolae]|nr:hypothetical protein H0H93_015992 [Arthromyces matolae]
MPLFWPPQKKEGNDIDAKIKKWHEERTARKRKGELESASAFLADLIQQNASAPLNIASVRVVGATTTRRSFLASLINPILSSSDPPANLESVLTTTRKISNILQQTDIFRSVEAVIERSHNASSNPNDVDVIFRVQEHGRTFLHSASELGNNEGNASATGRLRNVFGSGQVLEANVSFGTKTKRSFRVSFTEPLSSDLKTYGELTAFRLQRDNTSYASSHEGLQGVKAMIRNGLPTYGAHEFAYEGVMRYIGDLTPTASISMREAAGHSLKSALSHTYVIDCRNDRTLPTQGHYAKFSNEFAGLGGDASFYKSELQAQVARPIIGGVAVSLAARAGVLYDFKGSSFFSDRFQLGGPFSVRAFRANSLGPRDGSDSLGGDLYWSAGASLVSNLPIKPDWPLKVHLWLNAGRLEARDQSRPWSDTVQRTFGIPSVSVGLGFAYRFEPVRVEVNFGAPLIANKGDGGRRGVQVGMGFEFL